MDDSLEKTYPSLYVKSIEADSKIVELTATLSQIKLNFKSEQIQSITDSIVQSLSIHEVAMGYYFTNRKEVRLQNDRERNKNLYDLYINNFQIMSDSILEIMTSEYLK